MPGFDRFVAKLPGSVQVQAFSVGMVLCIAMGYPIFVSGQKEKQGHDYFSQERPEAILQGEESSRKKYLAEREVRREERKRAAQE
jgi:hypothetical protein